MGKHVAQVEAHEVVTSMKVSVHYVVHRHPLTPRHQAFWASLIVYYLSLGLTKGSMLLQYRRIFPTKKFQIFNWTIMGVVIAYTFWTVFGSIFACVPVRAFWTREKASCLNQYAMWL